MVAIATLVYTMVGRTHLSFSGNGSTTLILISVYSCGPTPSPLARSWSILGWPSRGEKMVCLRAEQGQDAAEGL